MATPHSPTQNHVLAALPAAKFERLSPHLELVPMPLGEALYESGAGLGYVYFPTTFIVSLLDILAGGASAEIGVVGNEGILSISLFTGGETTTSRAVVQSPGYGHRLPAHVLKREFSRGGPMFARPPLQPERKLAQPGHAGCDTEPPQGAPLPQSGRPLPEFPAAGLESGGRQVGVGSGDLRRAECGWERTCGWVPGTRPPRSGLSCSFRAPHGALWRHSWPRLRLPRHPIDDDGKP